jgi:hypothetical protein
LIDAAAQYVFYIGYLKRVPLISLIFTHLSSPQYTYIHVPLVSIPQKYLILNLSRILALRRHWQDHKLNAMDNPYGTCHARLKGDCPHMEAPPCLTCNGGSPCKDLAIGFSELDVQKYELHIKTTSRAIEVAKQHGREDMAEKHEKNLLRYQGILNNLQEGNIIFGRQDRIKRKVGAGNG